MQAKELHSIVINFVEKQLIINCSAIHVERSGHQTVPSTTSAQSKCQPKTAATRVKQRQGAGQRAWWRVDGILISH